MRSIAIMNQKGGVGKTTTAVNLGAALAESGRRVCLVDLDPQAHASLHLGVEPAPNLPTVFELLLGKAALAEVRRPVGGNLDLIPASLDLAAAEVELSGTVGREVILRDKLARDENPPEYLVIDCPPSLGILTLNALAAVDEVLIPLQPHFLALHGLGKLLQTIEVVARRLNSRLVLGGVILCMYDASTRLAAEVAADVEAFFENARGQETPWKKARTFKTRIRRNIRLAEAPSFGQSILQYASSSPGAEDYRQLADEILSRAE